MALILPIELPQTGAIATYWRITHVQMDRNAGVTDAQLHGYLDEVARRAGRAPLHHIPFRFCADSLPSPHSIAIADLYRAIREAAESTDEACPHLPARFRDAAEA